jgi:hypothetical protein
LLGRAFEEPDHSGEGSLCSTTFVNNPGYACARGQRERVESFVAVARGGCQQSLRLLCFQRLYLFGAGLGSYGRLRHVLTDQPPHLRLLQGFVRDGVYQFHTRRRHGGVLPIV